jgi:hypothetical protein
MRRRQQFTDGKLQVLKDLQEMSEGTDSALNNESFPSKISYKSFKT